MAKGRKPNVLRWTAEFAGQEFGTDHRTLSKWLKQAGEVPGDDGKYSTRQICAAVYGDLAGEKLGKARAERQLLEIELAKERGLVVPVEVARELLEKIIMHVRNIVRGSLLSDTEKNEILGNIRSINPRRLLGSSGRGTGQRAEPDVEAGEVAPEADGGGVGG